MTRTPSGRLWRVLLVGAAVLPVCGWMLVEAQRVFRADWESMAARKDIARWLTTAAGEPTAQAWEGARAALQSSLNLTPGDPDLHERLGDLYSVAGRRDWNDNTLRTRHFAAAAHHYEAALQRRPGAPGAWAALAVAKQAAGAEAAGVHAAWEKALKLGPFEGHVRPLLLQVVLAGWDTSTPRMQRWAKELFDKSDGATRVQINELAKTYGLKFVP